MLSGGVTRTGGLLTMAFVHPEDLEPIVAVDDQGTNGNDHDYVALVGKDGGESGISGHVSTGEWASSGGSSPTPGVPPQEHTPINETYSRVEGAVQGNQQYGGTRQNAIRVALASNGVLHGGV